MCQDGCGSRRVDEVSEVETGEFIPYTTLSTGSATYIFLDLMYY